MMTPSWIEALQAVIWPETCLSCGCVLLPGEKDLCLECRHNLPVTNLHHSEFNELHRHYLADVRVERAASYFYYYHDSPYAEIIRRAKYNGYPSMSRRWGADYARILKSVGFFDGIDAIVPVPLHWTKLLRRGYNQSEEIARGMAKETELPVILLLKAHRHASQTDKTVDERRRNARNAYYCDDKSALKFRHLLLVDDVITVGATATACVKALHLRYCDVKVSVVSLALSARP